MIAAWVTAGVALLTMLGLLIRLSYQVGMLVQRFGDHVSQSARTFADQETRIRFLERQRRRGEARPSGGHI